MRDVAIVSFAQLPPTRHQALDDTEMLVPVITEALAQAGVKRQEIGFTVSGSCDYLVGRPFSFVMALDAVGAWPPIQESHVEMDGAWALYEAWVRLQHGDIDTALVYAFGKSSLGEIRDVLTMQLDPYHVAPLWPDAVSLAALQARALLDAGRCTEQELAEIAVKRGKGKPGGAGALLASPYVVSPLRRHDCPPVSDGAAAIVLVAGERAKRACARPAWIRGIDHRIETQALGARDLTRSPSTALAGRKAGLAAGAAAPAIDVAELHAPFSHQEVILREALALGADVDVNPSGGALAANPVMVAGLTRLGEAARRIHDGSARRAVAHATSGPCLQQNLVCLLDAQSAVQ